MEKPVTAKPKIKLLKFLPRAASAISFQYLPFSPRKSKKARVNENKLIDSSLIGNNHLSIMPKEVTSHQKLKSSSFREREPTSPKISCMGHIKQGKKCCKPSLFLMPTEIKQCSAKFKASSAMKPAFFLPEAKKKQSSFKNGAKPAGRKSDAYAHIIPRSIDRAPSLSQMKRFASCRGALAHFDWTKAQIESDDHLENRRFYCSDEDVGDSDGEYEAEEVVIVPFFASCGHGGRLDVEPRKEINLWQRRTIDQPTPLQINACIIRIR